MNTVTTATPGGPMVGDENDTYRRNLAAISRVQPDVAEILRTVSIPAHVRRAVGRDGTPTFLIARKGERREWFGRSSMPTISASETYAAFRSDGRNIALPGVLTGMEPLILARKLPPHTALFVIERNPLFVVMALHVRDFTEHIEAGNIVIVLDEGAGESLAAGLRRFFERHPGVELPTTMLTAPQRTSAEIADLQRRLESTGRAASAVHAEIVSRHLEALKLRPTRALPAQPRVAVLSVDPNSMSLEHARRVQRAMGRLRWPSVVCIPDAPDRCHLAARLQTIQDGNVDAIVFVNGGAGHLLPLLPPGFPVVSWFFPGAAVERTAVLGAGAENRTPQTDSKRPVHVVLSSTSELSDSLSRAGVPTDCVMPCDPAADDSVFLPRAGLNDNGGSPRSFDVAVFFDLPDDRPEACGVSLASHLGLWRALQASLNRGVDGYRPDAVASILQLAQEDSGTALRDAATLDLYRNHVKQTIAPASIARSAVAALVPEGHRVAVWGRNWNEAGIGTRWEGAIPMSRPLCDAFHRAAIVLLPLCTPTSIQTALDAMAAGTCVVMRRPEELFELIHPGLVPLEKHMNLYRESGALARLIRRLLSRPEERAARCEAARRDVLAGHTVADRLGATFDELRARMSAIAVAG